METCLLICPSRFGTTLLSRSVGRQELCDDCDGDVKVTGKGKAGKSKTGQKYEARSPIKWNDELQEIVEGLIAHLKSGEVIAFPNFDLPFFMTKS